MTVGDVCVVGECGVEMGVAMLERTSKGFGKTLSEWRWVCEG